MTEKNTSDNAFNINQLKTEVALSFADKIFRAAFCNNSLAMSISRLSDGLIIGANEAYLQTTGFKLDEVIGKTAHELGIWLQPGDRKQLLGELIENGCIKDKEYTVRRANGDICHALISVSLVEIDGEKYLINSSQDITGRKKAEEALETSQKLFYQMFNGFPFPIVITALQDYRIVIANDIFYNMHNMLSDEMIGHKNFHVQYWHLPEQIEAYADLVTTNGAAHNFEIDYVLPSGQVRTVLISGVLIDWNDEKCMLTVGNDITERKQAELKVRASEDKFSKSFYGSGTMKGIARLKDGVIIDVNESYASTVGFTREEIIGKTELELGLWEDPSERHKMKEELVSKGSIRNWEYSYKTKSGEVGNVISNIDVINIDGEECFLFSSNDITKLRQYEREISRLDKLDLMGQMAGSIAHEIRNPMTSIRGFLQLFHEQYRYREDREAIELMIEELDRANDIISTFLSVSKTSLIELKPVKLNDCINDVLQLVFADAVKNDVFVQTEYHDNSPIMIDKREIRQLLLNLARNAIDAMPQGGNLKIKTFEDNNGVHLVVQDEGKGIPPEIVEKIWTPFVTTKGNGTGLGLPVCLSNAERHNAEITFDTSPQGTSFKVTFPAALTPVTE